tara:strand:+ start:2034 stop:4643 length:2610 start_codon:yes stop_codon:yes gene_type:complete
MVEESSLFNPYFLGSSFKWWVAQIPEDGTWRENISCQSHEGADTQKGWGYRYKVRVLGVHDKDEEIVKSEDLPWAQVMYPVTAGSGGAGSMQTPNIRQGMFVVGFWLDDQDMEYPMIMGVLGNNNQNTPKNSKEISTTASNFGPVSGYAKGKNPDASVRVSDDQLKTDAQSFKEDVSDIHEIVSASTRKHNLYTGFNIPLSSPLKKDGTAMTSIMKTIDNIINIINDIQHAMASPIDAVSKHTNFDIPKILKDATKSIGGFIKNIVQGVRGFVTKTFSEGFSKTVDFVFPSDRGKLFSIKGMAFKGLAGSFSKIIGMLPGVIGKFLEGSFGKYPETPSSENQMVSPLGRDPLSGVLDGISTGTAIIDSFGNIIDGTLENGTKIVGGTVNVQGNLTAGGTYNASIVADGNNVIRGRLEGNNNSSDGIRVTGGFISARTNEVLTAPEVASRPLSERPVAEYERRKQTRKQRPMCATEALVGNVLGVMLPEITSATQTAVRGVESFMTDYYGELAVLPNGLDTLSKAGVDQSIFMPVPSDTENFSEGSGNDPTRILTSIRDRVQSGTDIVNRTYAAIETSIAGDLPVEELSRLTGINPTILNAANTVLSTDADGVDVAGAALKIAMDSTGIGVDPAIAAAAVSGDFDSLADLGAQAAINAIPGANQALDTASNVLGSVTGLLGSFGGSLAQGMSFVNSIMGFFSFDEEPESPQSNSYRFHDGSEGPGQADVPNMSNVQEAAAATQDLNIEVKEQPFAAPSQEGLFNPSTGLINQDVAGVAADGSLIESLKTSNLPWDVEEDTPYSGYPDDLPTVGGAPLGRDQPIRTILDYREDPNNPGFALADDMGAELDRELERAKAGDRSGLHDALELF